ncbi:MAG: hypothetical protein JF618_11125 [Leifsonia sp.]|nr:hypothetical protein [Leifsonia sp.]
MITLTWLLVLALIGGALALIDGIIRVRGRGTAILAVIEIIVAALFLLSLFVPGIPFGSVVLAIALLIVLVIQLVLRGSTRRSGVTITVVSIIVTAIWLILTLGWVHIPGVN